MRLIPALLQIPLLLVLLTGMMPRGCSPHFGPTLSSSYKDSTTVSVLMFVNNAPLAKATLPQTFTESLRDGIQSQTRLQLVRSNSDLVFEGSIIGYSVSPVAIQGGNDQAAINRLTMTVSVKFTDFKDEKKNFEQSFSRFSDFSSSQSLQSVEDGLIKDITDQIVQDIINRAINVW